MDRKSKTPQRHVSFSPSHSANYCTPPGMNHPPTPYPHMETPQPQPQPKASSVKPMDHRRLAANNNAENMDHQENKKGIRSLPKKTTDDKRGRRGEDQEHYAPESLGQGNSRSGDTINAHQGQGSVPAIHMQVVNNYITYNTFNINLQLDPQLSGAQQVPFGLEMTPNQPLLATSNPPPVEKKQRPQLLSTRALECGSYQSASSTGSSTPEGSLGSVEEEEFDELVDRMARVTVVGPDQRNQKQSGR